jgi:hypothetical protein
MTARHSAVCALLLVLLCAPVLLAADVTGTWSGEVKLPNGQALPFVAHLKQDGSKVSGRMDGIGGAPDVEIMNGAIKDDVVTFSGVRQIQGAGVKFNYTGKVSGETIDFAIVREDGQGAPLRTLTKRTK